MSGCYNRFTRSEINVPSVTEASTSGNSEGNTKETSSQGRTRKELSLKEKLEILKLYDQLPKMSQRSAANQLNISQPVLCKILKNRSFIENIILTNENSVRKRTRGGKERDVELALKCWYVEMQEKKVPINGQIIREKAKELARQMGKEFAATDGWLTRWRKRENIVYNSLFRRKLKPDCGENEPKNAKRRICRDADVKFADASQKYDPDSVKCQTPAKSRSESNLDESDKWETGVENICQVFIKSEPIYEEEFEFKEKPDVDPPTDEEMLEALRILNSGVKHRTNDLQLHYEYEHFIYQLLRNVDKR